MTNNLSILGKLKTGLQNLGRSLSDMVMPNIGAFIAWGFIMALFIPNGWMPNEKLAQLGDPMMKYLLPLLIGYTAGSMVHGVRGGVTGAIATAGVIVGSDIPMFIGAMIMGPLGGWCIKKFASWTKGKVGEAFVVLVDNFSVGIIGFALALIAFLLIGGIVVWLTTILKVAVEWLIAKKLLPLVSVLGVLLACSVFGDKMEKQSAPGAAVIHFLGGIHEIYFPYVLSRPALLIAPILGSFSALLFYTLTGTGLVAPAAPGSVIAILAMAPKGKFLAVLAGMLIATAVSFIVASPILKIARKKNLQE